MPAAAPSPRASLKIACALLVRLTGPSAVMCGLVPGARLEDNAVVSLGGEAVCALPDLGDGGALILRGRDAGQDQKRCRDTPSGPTCGSNSLTSTPSSHTFEHALRTNQAMRQPPALEEPDAQGDYHEDGACTDQPRGGNGTFRPPSFQEQERRAVAAGGTRTEDIYPCCALGCLVCHQNCVIPACIGGHLRGDCLCCDCRCGPERRLARHYGFGPN